MGRFKTHNRRLPTPTPMLFMTNNVNLNRITMQTKKKIYFSFIIYLFFVLKFFLLTKRFCQTETDFFFVFFGININYVPHKQNAWLYHLWFSLYFNYNFVKIVRTEVWGWQNIVQYEN